VWPFDALGSHACEEEKMKASELWKQIKPFEHFNTAKNLSSKTLVSYGKGLKAFRKWFDGTHDPDTDVNAVIVREYLAYRLKRGNSPCTVKSYAQTLRTFFSYLVQDEIIAEQDNPMRRVKSPRVTRAEIEPLNEGQIEAFLRTFNMTRLAEYRDYVMCSLILDSGLRTTETLTILLEDVDFEQRTIRVNGKGNKIRTVFFGEKLGALLQDYIHRCRCWLRNDSPSLFPPRWSGSGNTYLGPEQFSTMVKDRLDRIGVKRSNSSAHRLRHTFAVLYLRNEGNLFALQTLLGHTTLDMTRRYVKLAQTDLANDHQKASPMDAMGL